MSTTWKKHTQGSNPKSVAVGVLSLLDHCYARGVKDACNSKDEMMCREFLEKTDIPGNFGFMWKDRDSRFDLNTWGPRQFITEIMYISTLESIQNRKKIFDFLSKILNPSIYHFCILHIAQEFYKQGMLDYMKYPNPQKLYTILDKPTNKVWTENGAKRKDRRFTLFRMQNACNDRALRCEESINRGENNKYATNKVSFTNFQNTIWYALFGIDFYISEGKEGNPPKERDDN